MLASNGEITQSTPLRGWAIDNVHSVLLGSLFCKEIVQEQLHYITCMCRILCKCCDGPAGHPLMPDEPSVVTISRMLKSHGGWHAIQPVPVFQLLLAPKHAFGLSHAGCSTTRILLVPPPDGRLFSNQACAAATMPPLLPASAWDAMACRVLRSVLKKARDWASADQPWEASKARRAERILPYSSSSSSSGLSWMGGRQDLLHNRAKHFKCVCVRIQGL